MSDAVYPMKAVVAQTGLSSHVIRVWERRYQAVVPQRTETNRRLYTRNDIERLLLLRRAVDGGHAIGRIAGIPNEELRQILDSAATPGRLTAKPSSPVESRSAEEYLQLAVEASRQMDAKRLEHLLGLSETELGRHVLVTRIISGLLEAVGDLWTTGEIRPSQEHLTSSVVRNYLGSSISGSLVPESAPAIVLATPSGHIHELGCLMAATIAVMQGWKVVYLGSSLPAEEIAGAVMQTRANVVGLSLVYPTSNHQTRGELTRLLKLLPPETHVLFGGREAPSYRDLESEHVRFVDRIEDLHSVLEQLEV